MKIGVTFPLTLALSFGMTTFGWAAPTAMAVNADATKYVVQVEGMTWGVSCVAKVRATLAKLDGVQGVEVDFAAKEATVAMKPQAHLGKTAVTEAIEGAGFTVAAFQEVKSAKQEKGEQKQERKKEPKKKVAKAARYDVGVSGMTWAVNCTKSAREALTKIDGVKEVKVDFEKKTATVLMKEGKHLAKDDAAKALQTKGFTVASFGEHKAKPKKKKAGEGHEGVEKKGERKEIEKKKGGGDSSFVLAVSGMTWGVSCVAKVRETLASIDGVEDVKVDFAGKTATVTLAKDAKVNAAAAKAALKEKGYGAELKKDG